MILTLSLEQLKENEFLYEQMFRLRTKIFHEKMGWDVKVNSDGLEIDEFDAGDVMYVVCLDKQMRLLGTARLLKTTSPTMLSTVFNCLISDGSTPNSPTIWESTRFAVDTENVSAIPNQKVNWVTGELLCGIYEFALENNVTEMVSVFDIFIERILKRAGCEFERLGDAIRIGKVKAVAASFPMSYEILENIRTIVNVQLENDTDKSATAYKAA
ncbi:MAG: GNAT family N-acetyltransferase [Hyphomicrobiales bacterium]